MVFYFLGIEIGVRMESRKNNVKEKAIHFGIPSSRILLNTIDRFIKVINKAGVNIYIVWRFFHVNLFL